MPSIEQALDALPHRSVGFGMMTVELASSGTLKEIQCGYSVDKKGKPLSGVNPGDWQKSWVVIGYEDMCGDPLFVDSAEADLPVYIAAHGEGEWDPDMVSPTFEAFTQSLQLIHEAAKQVKGVSLDDVSLSRKEETALLKKLVALNGDSYFWDGWVRQWEEAED